MDFIFSRPISTPGAFACPIRSPATILGQSRPNSDSSEGKSSERSPAAIQPLISSSTSLQTALFTIFGAVLMLLLVRVRPRPGRDPPWWLGSITGIFRPRPSSHRPSAWSWYQTVPSRSPEATPQSVGPVLTRSFSPSPGKRDLNQQLGLTDSSRNLRFQIEALPCCKQDPAAAALTQEELGQYWRKVQTRAWIFPILTDVPETEVCCIFALDAEFWLKEHLGPWSLMVRAEAQKDRICVKFALVAIHMCGWFANSMFHWCGWYLYRDGFDIGVAGDCW